MQVLVSVGLSHHLHLQLTDRHHVHGHLVRNEMHLSSITVSSYPDSTGVNHAYCFCRLDGAGSHRRSTKALSQRASIDAFAPHSAIGASSDSTTGRVGLASSRNKPTNYEMRFFNSVRVLPSVRLPASSRSGVDIVRSTLMLCVCGLDCGYCWHLGTAIRCVAWIGTTCNYTRFASTDSGGKYARPRTYTATHPR